MLICTIKHGKLVVTLLYNDIMKHCACQHQSIFFKVIVRLIFRHILSVTIKIRLSNQTKHERVCETSLRKSFVDVRLLFKQSDNSLASLKNIAQVNRSLTYGSVFFFFSTRLFFFFMKCFTGVKPVRQGSGSPSLLLPPPGHELRVLLGVDGKVQHPHPSLYPPTRIETTVSRILLRILRF